MKVAPLEKSLRNAVLYHTRIWVNSRIFCISAKYEYKSKLHYSDASAQL